MKNPASQTTITPHADGVVSPASQAALTPLVDELLDLYVSWREESAAVATSYENWSASERRDNRLAFSAYLAALDREEHAAATYRSQVERIAKGRGGSAAIAQRPARDEQSDSASVTRWGLRRIVRETRRGSS
jgi:hypothetical protein